ncbi:MAG: protoporphyrinogen oxidase HemJ [Synechococcaceae cyanobacterium SM2_3_1]|nr:protoporphyrinogen oxidase HemJ [Synechococcaceae cyanobacterium SM2_3_1]
MVYFWLKSFHLIGMVVWFAGLFYLVRLYVYHVEATEKPEPAQSILTEQYQVMETRLYRLITTPGMIVTLVMAAGMLGVQPSLLREGWLHIKLLLVGGLVGYHFYCGWLMKQFSLAEYRLNSQQLRTLNEVPTLILVAVVCLAVFKSTLPIYSVSLVLLGLTLLILAVIQFYAWKRSQTEGAQQRPIPDAPSTETDLEVELQ